MAISCGDRVASSVLRLGTRREDQASSSCSICESVSSCLRPLMTCGGAARFTIRCGRGNKRRTARANRSGP